MDTDEDYYSDEHKRLFENFINYFKHEKEFKDNFDRLKCLASLYLNLRFLSCSYDERLVEKVERMAQAAFAHDEGRLARKRKHAVADSETETKFSRPVKSTDKCADQNCRRLSTLTYLIREKKLIYHVFNDVVKLWFCASLTSNRPYPSLSLCAHLSVTFELFKFYVTHYTFASGDPFLDDILTRLVIYQNRSNEELKHLLNASASFSRMRIVYVESNEDEKFKCDIYINEDVAHDGSQKHGCFLCSGLAETKNDAKEYAAQTATDILRRHCYAIQVKNYIDPHRSQVDVDKNGAASTSTQECSKEKITGGLGAKLMAKMGWSGTGGIGKTEQGRKEPVEVLQRFARHGLGSLLVDRNFNKIVKSIIEEYAKSDEEQDLVFAANLSNEQRKFIHKMAGHFNLRHVSYGSGSERQLTIQKRKSALQIVDYLLSTGGEDGKYKLIFPDET